MSDRISPNVTKLLRVLVAGGMALAGVGGARAEDQPATAPTEKTEKDKEAEKANAEKAAKEQEAKKKAEDEKKAEEAKKAAQTDQGGGVRGW